MRSRAEAARIPCYRKIVSIFVSIAIAAASLSGCYLPEVGALTDHQNKKELFYAVVRGVQCEIRKAVYKEVNDPIHRNKLTWLKDWSALMHFEFTFDTTASFNPGVTLLTPNLPFAHVWRAPDLFEDPTMPERVTQSYNFDVGAGVSGGVKKVEDVEFFYPFNEDFFDLAKKDGERSCYRLGGLTIGGDLKLYEWLDDVLEPIKRCAFIGSPATGRSTTVPVIDLDLGSERDNIECPDKLVRTQGYSADAPLRTFSHQVIFKITFSAHATPQWKLVRIATGGDLFKAGRDDTFDLKITMGSPKKEEKLVWQKKGDRVHRLRTFVTAPSEEMTYRDLSLQIGAAVRDNLQR